MRLNHFSSGVILSSLSLLSSCGVKQVEKRPNIVFVFADQWRYQATSFGGDKNVRTPNLDNLTSECVNFTNSYSCVSASTPYRGTMLTGQYPLTHGLFLNDVGIDSDVNSIAKVYAAAGYNTAYVGKWHVSGKGRSRYIEPKDRLGFQYFKGLECSHDYNKSAYYFNNDTTKMYWDGYDAFPQTDDVINYMSDHCNDENPFIIMLSLGAPHNPYATAPQEYQQIYDNMDIELRANVPEELKEEAISKLKGYYAHISALDDCMGRLQQSISDLGIEDNTIFVFTSDHGDMLMSQGLGLKQKPYEESIHVPFLMKYPDKFGKSSIKTDVLFNAMDIMPTLLSLSGIDIPESVEGRDVSKIILGEQEDNIEGTLIASISPFGEFHRNQKGIKAGREYRGVRTKQHTYVRDLNGAWLLFDNFADPYQLNNIVNLSETASIQKELDDLLNRLLAKQKDEFLPGDYYIKKWGYMVDKDGTAPYTL